MDLTELQIGNIIHPKNSIDSFVAKIRDIKDNVISFETWPPLHSNLVEPINLTVNWLNQIMGEKINDDDGRPIYRVNNIVVEVLEDFEIAVYDFGHRKSKIIYVHQLQNLISSRSVNSPDKVWIEVSSSLPKLNKEVLIFSSTQGFAIGTLEQVELDTLAWQTWDVYSDFEKYTHWRNLPEPPNN